MRHSVLIMPVLLLLVNTIVTQLRSEQVCNLRFGPTSSVFALQTGVTNPLRTSNYVTTVCNVLSGYVTRVQLSAGNIPARSFG